MASHSQSREIQDFILLAQQGKRNTDLDRMRKIADHVLRQNRSQNTKDRYWAYYKRNFKKMHSEASEAGLNMHEYFESLPRSKSTKNWLSAMYQYSACAHVSLLIQDIREAREQSDRDRGCLARKQASELIYQVLLMEPDYTKNHWQRRTHDGQGFTETGEQIRKKRKRRELRLLPLDWRSMTMAEIKEEFQLVALVQAASGCRTSELANGISITTENNKLFFKIKGAKTNQGHGQAWREFSILSDGSSIISQLLQKVDLAKFEAMDWNAGLEIKLIRPDAYRKHITASARAAGLDRVSPICFRHQMASDLKSSGYSYEKIAMIMGHCSDMTADKHYGLKHKGQYIKVDNVKAAQPVRIHKPCSKKSSRKPQKPGPQ